MEYEGQVLSKIRSIKVERAVGEPGNSMMRHIYETLTTVRTGLQIYLKNNVMTVHSEPKK
jgi:hypothetical protein